MAKRRTGSRARAGDTRRGPAGLRAAKTCAAALALPWLTIAANAAASDPAPVESGMTTPVVSSAHVAAASHPPVRGTTGDEWTRQRVDHDDGEGADAEAPEPQTHWYGWQTLATDGAAVTLFIAGASADSGAVAVLGVGTYVLGGPVVHWTHDGGWRGWASLGIRVGGPVLVGLGGFALGSGCEGEDAEVCPAVGAALFGSLGLVSAIIVDAAVLGYEEVKPSDDEISWTPTVDVGRSQARLGVAGTF